MPGPSRCLAGFALVADALRLEDDAAAWRHDALANRAAVAIRIGVIAAVIAAVPAVAEARAHAGANRPHLDADAAGIRPGKELCTGRRRQSKGRGRNGGKQKLFHRSLLWFGSLLWTQRVRPAGVAKFPAFRGLTMG